MLAVCFLNFLFSVVMSEDFFAWGIASILSLYILMKEWKTDEL